MTINIVWRNHDYLGNGMLTDENEHRKVENVTAATPPTKFLLLENRIYE